MTDSARTTTASAAITIRHATSRDDLIACFPVISELRINLQDSGDWADRAWAMAPAGYRVLAAWHSEKEKVVAVAGYRIMENLIYGRFLYVEDLVTAADQRKSGLGTALLEELSQIGAGQDCKYLVLDTAAANTDARRFYERHGLLSLVVGFVKPLDEASAAYLKQYDDG